MIKKLLFLITSVFFISFLIFPLGVYAQDNTINIDIKSLLPNTLSNAKFFVSPNNGTILENTTFDVMFFINTNKNSINTIDLNIKFPADKLTVTKPSEGKSLIGIWLKPPTYSNTEGTARFVGIIPNGITTESGLIITRY